MKRDPIKHLRIECERVLAQLERIRALPVKAAAELLGISPAEVRAKLPVTIYGPKTHRVTLDAIERFKEQRTVQP